MAQGMQEGWEALRKAGAKDSEEQHVVHFLYGPSDKKDPWKQTSPRNVAAAKALVDYVARLQAQRDALAAGDPNKREPIYILGYSNGAIVTTLALEMGMKVDGVVFAGSALDRTHDMKKAASGTGFLINNHSPSDGVVNYVTGSGDIGFNLENQSIANLKNRLVYGIEHYKLGIGDVEFSSMEPSAARSALRDKKNPQTNEWVSRYMGYDYYAAQLSATTTGLSDQYNRTTGAKVSQYDSGVK